MNQEWIERKRRAANTPKKRRETSLHESGHAIEAYLQNVQVRTVTIRWKFRGRDADYDSYGRTNLVWPDDGQFSPGQSLKACRIALAGRIAEQLGLGKRLVMRYDCSDLETIKTAALLFNPLTSERTRDAWVRWLWFAVIDDIRLRWPKVEAVAKQLLKCETLSGADLSQIIRAHRENLG